MSSLHTLSNVEGARIDSFRKGRGRGSGNGKTAGKGMKGQGAHAHTKKNGYEGGQTPIARRLPKFGFRKSHKNRRIVNVFNDGDVVNAATLLEKNIVKKELDGVKILGRGKLTKKLVVEAKAFSASAKKAIEDNGGQAKVIE